MRTFQPEVVTVDQEVEKIARALLDGELPVALEISVVPQFQAEPDLSLAEEPATAYDD